jgi:Raptor N-terminal CASPase like domain
MLNTVMHRLMNETALCVAVLQVWVFNKTYTQYIPLSVYDIKAWAGNPSIYVLDCSAAGVLLPHFMNDSGVGTRLHLQI